MADKYLLAFNADLDTPEGRDAYAAKFKVFIDCGLVPYHTAPLSSVGFYTLFGPAPSPMDQPF